MKYTIPLLILLLTACTGSMTPTETPPPPTPIPTEIPTPLPSATPAPTPEWNLLWSDEFEGPAGASPDPAKWAYNLGGEGWGNREWEFYTDQPENASLDGRGNLVITALAVENPPASGQGCWYGPCRYTSARLLTQNRFEFTYGRVEARLRLPFGQGVWPAFWMLGANISEADWPVCGEIDIMENIGHQLSTSYGTVHGPGYSGADGISAAYQLPEGQAFRDDFHVFAVEWEEGEVRWYVDGNLFATVRKSELSLGKIWVFDHPFFIIMNVAVGGNWPGYPDESTTFPQTMVVDYVRVYQRP